MRVLLPTFLALASAACSFGNAGSISAPATQTPRSDPNSASAAPNPFPVIHVFVALCDNVNQGIVPVSPSLGNGDNPATNLYWGAAFGIKTFFKKSRDWELLAETKNPQAEILERCVFKHKTREIFLVADAYRGKEIKKTTHDFLEAASGRAGENIKITGNSQAFVFQTGAARISLFMWDTMV